MTCESEIYAYIRGPVNQERDHYLYTYVSEEDVPEKHGPFRDHTDAENAAIRIAQSRHADLVWRNN